MPEGYKRIVKDYTKELHLDEGQASVILEDILPLMKEMAEALEEAYQEQVGTCSPTKVEITLKKFKEWK